MPIPSTPITSILNNTVEEEVYNLLVQYYSPIYHDGVRDYVNIFMAVDPMISRFLYLESVVGDEKIHQNAKILISGCGVGSEHIVARYFGFGEVYGVEVDEFLVDACKKRLEYLPDMHTSYYNGDYLPYAENQFHFVVSGHVIEHTRDPVQYLRECMRVLLPNGYLSLEFPNRYHRIELHTRLPSFEWLPRPLRNVCLRLISSQVSPLSDSVKIRYQSIIGTNLQQISMAGIKRILRQNGQPFDILNRIEAAPGIIRCVIQKRPR